VPVVTRPRIGQLHCGEQFGMMLKSAGASGRSSAGSIAGT
jgi:hypothetical protein